VDDVFVWVDLWRQQDRSVSLEDRMIQTLGESDEWAVAVAVYDARLCPHCSYQAPCPLAVAVTTHGICPHCSYQAPCPLAVAVTTHGICPHCSYQSPAVHSCMPLARCLRPTWSLTLNIYSWARLANSTKLLMGVAALSGIVLISLYANNANCAFLVASG